MRMRIYSDFCLFFHYFYCQNLDNKFSCKKTNILLDLM